MGGDAGRPGPGEELNAGERTVPRVAASVIVVRGGADTLEVLLVRRTPEARFMGGVWVFPGGAVDAGEDEHDAALRELHEEAAIDGVARGDLVRFSRWITPAAVKIRYDTHFFLAPLPAGAQPEIDGQEIVDLGWFEPRGALDAHAREEIQLVFPTIKHLEQLEVFASADELLERNRGRDVLPTLPKVVVEGEVARVLLPGEPGYDDAGRATPG